MALKEFSKEELGIVIIIFVVLFLVSIPITAMIFDDKGFREGFSEEEKLQFSPIQPECICKNNHNFCCIDRGNLPTLICENYKLKPCEGRLCKMCQSN